MNNFHEQQSPASYVNKIPLQKVWGGNVDGSFTLSNDTQLIFSIYYQTVLQEHLAGKARREDPHAKKNSNTTIQPQHRM